MCEAITTQVIEFYDDLFRRVFVDQFEADLTDPIRRRAVTRDIAESADAVSLSMTRFFVNQQLTEGQAGDVLNGLARLGHWIELDLINNPNLAPEVLAESFDGDNPCPEEIKRASAEPLYRVALETVVQVLLLVGPVMVEWRKVGFSREFELLNRVIDRLNEISERMGQGQRTLSLLCGKDL